MTECKRLDHHSFALSLEPWLTQYNNEITAAMTRYFNLTYLTRLFLLWAFVSPSLASSENRIANKPTSNGKLNHQNHTASEQSSEHLDQPSSDAPSEAQAELSAKNKTADHQPSNGSVIPRQEPTLVITAKPIPQTKETVDSSVTNISSRSISRSTAQQFSRLVSLVPGTWVSRGNGQEHLTAIRSPVFTGPGACAVFIMSEDGLPLRPTSFCNVNQLFESHFEVADFVEVYRGSNSTTAGSNAVFGMINTQLPSPSENLVGSVTYNTAQFGFNQLSIQQPWESQDWSHWLGITLTDDHGYREESGYQQQKLSFKNSYEYGNFSILNGFNYRNLDQQTAGYVEGDNAYLDRTLSRENNYPEAWRKATSVRAYSKLNWTLTDTSLSFTPYFRVNDMSFLMHFVPWQPTEENQQTSFGFDLLWHNPIDQPLHGFIGFEYEQTSGELIENQLNPAPFNQDAFPQGIHYNYQVDVNAYALLTGFRWQVTPLTTLAWNTRFDTLSYQYDNQTTDGSACADGISNCRFYRPADENRHFNFWSNQLSMSLTLTSQQRMYINLSQSFRVPQTSELYRLQQNQTFADLDEVSANGVELGWQANFDNISLEVAWFDMQLKDSIFQDTQRQFVSGADSSHRGFETELHWTISRHWQFNLSAGSFKHLYQNSPDLLGSNVQIKGNLMDTAPKTMGAIELIWRWNDQNEWMLQTEKMGKYFTNPENTHEYSGHVISHVRWQRKMGNSMSLLFGINNLTDKRYAERADIAFGTPRYFPGQERTLVFQLKWQNNP